MTSASSLRVPYVNGHVSGAIAWVDMIYVPKDLRKMGFGKTAYMDWELNLPKHVRLVKLQASDAGEGSSTVFWDRLGFSHQYDGKNLDYEAEHLMCKGVNGFRTPEPILVDALTS